MDERLSRLVDLCHHRRSLPVLAGLWRCGSGAKFILLVNRVGVGRYTLSRTLAALISLGYVKKNTGYGHPMRPEYLLTAPGRPLAECCERLIAAARQLGVEDVALRKWSLPVLAALAEDRSRFSQIREALPGVTARALAQALKQLHEAALIERVVYDDYPPQVEYRPTNAARRLRTHITSLIEALRR